MTEAADWDGPLTANTIAAGLAKLSRELVTMTGEYAQLNSEARTALAAYKVGYARAYLESEGTLEARKHEATVATADLLWASELAEAAYDNCRTALRVLGQRMDAGRTLASTVRAEAIASGAGMP